MSQKIIIPSPGDVVAEKYRIIEEIGRGAYGVVFLATQLGIDRKVAIKTLLPKAFLEEGIVERFEREAKFVGRLSHRNIVRVHDYGRHDNLLYMAVEYVEGRSLEEIISRDAPIEPDRVHGLADQMLDALDHAHQRGIVHRDLKPGNILVVAETLSDGDTRDVVKILDFGIAKLIQSQNEDENLQTLTQAGTVLGTPHYMSPESIIGDDVDHTADVYAFGVILFEMLTGRRPFNAKNSPSVMVSHLRDDPPPLPEFLATSCWGEAIDRCLVKQPLDRIQSASEIGEIIDRRDEGEPPEWWATTPPTEQLDQMRAYSDFPSTEIADDDPPEPTPRRNILVPIVAGILVGVLGAVGFWLLKIDDSAASKHRQPSVAPASTDESSDGARQDDQPAKPSKQPAIAAETNGSKHVEDQTNDEATGEAPSVEAASPDEDDNDGDSTGASTQDGRNDTSGDKAKPRERTPRTESEDAEERADEAGDSTRSNEPSDPAEEVAKVTLKLESRPDEARVKVDGDPAGLTPTEVTLDRSTEPVEIVFSHIGYQSKSRLVKPDKNRTIHVRLQKGRLKLVP